jgi:hypothetical protein
VVTTLWPHKYRWRYKCTRRAQSDASVPDIMAAATGSAAKATSL